MFKEFFKINEEEEDPNKKTGAEDGGNGSGEGDGEEGGDNGEESEGEDKGGNEGEDDDNKAGKKDGDGEEEGVSVFDFVEEELGYKFETKFEETKDGFKDYIKAHREHALKEFEENLKQTQPELFSVFEYVANGGSITDYFKVSTKELPKEIDKDSQKQQVAVLTSYYESKGIESDAIDILIKSAEKDGKLYDKSVEALTKINEENSKKQKEVLESQKKKKEEQANKDKAFAQNVLATVKSTFNDIKVPEKDQKPFAEYIFNQMQYSPDGDYQFAISAKDLNSALSALFFAYKKGDLKDMVKRKAASENLKRLGGKQKEEKSESQKSFSIKDFAKLK